MRTKYAFLHIPRTGGRYLENRLALLGPDKFVNFFGIGEGQEVNKLTFVEGIEYNMQKIHQLRSNPNFKSCSIFAGHFTTNFHVHFPEYDIRYVTIIRDPVSRMISWFYRICKFHYNLEPTLASFLTILTDKLVEQHGLYGFDNYMCRVFSGSNLNDPLITVNEYMEEQAFHRVLYQVEKVGDFSDYKRAAGDILKKVNAHFKIDPKQPTEYDVGWDLVEELKKRNQYDINLYKRIRDYHAI